LNWAQAASLRQRGE